MAATYQGVAPNELSSADEYPLRDNTYSDISPMHSPALPPFHQSGSDGDFSTREGSMMTGKYGYGTSESALHLPKEEAGYGSPLRQSTTKPSGIAGWSLRKKILVGGGAIVAVIVLAGVLGGVFGRGGDSDSSSSGSSSSDKSTEAPVDDEAAQKAGEGGDGTTITMENGNKFIYTNAYGGHWVSRPYDDSARANNDTPPLNEQWDYSSDKINGVNLGGWLVLEPFIVPAMFDSYDNQVIDEWDLSLRLGDNLTAAMTEHYETFITEQDFAEIAGAGLNWIRMPLGYWAVETYDDEAFLEGVSWQYFVKGLNWARKYGLRVQVDLHAVPGSQNGLNHSGKFGSINWLAGIMGITNAQRTLNYIRTITEFIAQPQYSNVAVAMMPVNEPYQEYAIGQLPMQSFYRQVYETVRGITGTGKGNGPMIMLQDGFSSQASFYGFMQGADRLGLESHHYLAFTADSFGDSYQSLVTRPCQWWASQYNQTFQDFGFVEAGEWSLATNDCGQYLNGVGLGAHFDGSYNTTSTPNERSYGSCETYTNVDNFSDEFKVQTKQMMTAYWDATRSWFFWTWKIGQNSTGQVPNPLWSYSLGLKEGYVPADPRPQAYLGACDALAADLDLPGKTNIQWTPPLAANMVGEADSYDIPASVTANYSAWPPALTNIPDVANLPVLTATGSIITLAPPPTPTGAFATGNATNVGNGWLNPSDTASYMVPISGCSYLNAYSGAGLPTPDAPCTGPAAVRERMARAIRTPAPQPRV